jgi:hypothetical protein
VRRSRRGAHPDTDGRRHPARLAAAAAPRLRQGTWVALDLWLAPVWVAADGWILARTLRWAGRRGVSSTWTPIGAYGLVVVFGAILFPIGIALDRPIDGTDAIAAVAKGAWLSMLILGVWSLFYVMPRAVSTSASARSCAARPSARGSGRRSSRTSCSTR